MKLPGGAKVQKVEQPVPVPGPGQVLLKMKAASLCGSDLKYIYYEHTDKTGGARYDDVIAGHEPSGQVVQVGEDVLDFKEGDRVVVYHIQGCGYCDECKKGFFLNARTGETCLRMAERRCTCGIYGSRCIYLYSSAGFPDI